MAQAMSPPSIPEKKMEEEQKDEEELTLSRKFRWLGMSSYTAPDTTECPFGLSRQQEIGLLNSNPDTQLSALLNIIQHFYAALPRPKTIKPIRVANVWKMDLLLPTDISPTDEAPSIIVAYTLWDETLECALRCPGDPSFFIAGAASSPIFFEDSDLHYCETIAALGMTGIPAMFGGGNFRLCSDVHGSEVCAKDARFMNDLLSTPRFKPYKVLVHDLALAKGLSTMQRNEIPLAYAVPLFEAIAIPSLPKPRHLKDGTGTSLLTVCSSCRDMGAYTKKAGVIKFMKRCSGCNISYYCSRACQEKHWPQHKLECKRNPRILSKLSKSRKMPGKCSTTGCPACREV